MQSTLQSNNVSLFPDLVASLGPLTKLRQSRIISIYLSLYAFAAILVLAFPHSPFATFGHSLVLPGAGFLGGAGTGSPIVLIDLTVPLLSLAVLGFAGFLWFATGNVVLPLAVWGVISFGSGLWQSQKLNVEFEFWTTCVSFSTGPAIIGSLYLYQFVSFKRGQARRTALNLLISKDAPKTELNVKDPKGELSFADLQHMRLLLDRALQPVDVFEGFEWLDQFQTAAVRYQINFISYALSLAQANYMPAFTGYLSTAQENLRAKQENHRIWKYWHLENLWGNLRGDRDPIARDNIMYSGFVGAQLAYARQSGPHLGDNLDGLNCRNGNAEFNYSQDDIIAVLAAQYRDADYGLLSCEPNWVYPLCNAISATAIRAHDTRTGSNYWDSIAEGFRRSLETEFITPSGHFIPFRSNYTGFAPPQIGGTVMQAFPCFFLNAVLPDIAQRQWMALKIEMEGKDWRKTLWPADVGNYGFSRASSYAATALAAREMGDDQIADLLLEHMQHDCPLVLKDGTAHYSKASLWANANAFMAKISYKNALQNLVLKPRAETGLSPYLADVDPMEVLIARAEFHQGLLSIVAYPARCAGVKQVKIAGLTPHASYKIHSDRSQSFTALADGTQLINCPLNGRTEIIIRKVT